MISDNYKTHKYSLDTA